MTYVAGQAPANAETPTGWRYIVPVVIVALLGTLISLGLFQRQRVGMASDTNAAVQSAVTQTAQHATRSLGAYKGSMAAYPGLFTVRGPLTEADFVRFTNATFEQRLDVESVVLAQQRGDALTVRYVGRGTSERLVGTDITADRLSRQAVRTAAQTRQTVLVARANATPAVEAYTPVFRDSTMVAVVVGSLDIAAWMGQASTTSSGLARLELVDATGPGERPLWTSDGPVVDQGGQASILVSSLQTLRVNGGPGPALLATAAPTWRPWAVLLGGLLITLVLCGLLWWWLDARRIKRTSEDLHQATKRLQFLAERDALTGLTHRDGLRSWLQEWDIRQPDRPLAVLFIDIDGFKEINTTWGHLSGDFVLRHLAHRISDLADGPDSVVARISGDQFVMMRALDVGDVDELAAAIQTLVSEPISVSDRDIQLSSSIGIALRPEDGRNLDTLINNADLAVRLAKETPGNSIEHFDPVMAARGAHAQQVAREFRAAMRDPDASFQLDFQPQIDMRTGTLVAAEALVRWHRSGEWVAPGDFLPVASEFGLMPELGEWVLRQSCLVVSRWREHTPAVVAVNVDAQQLDAGFADVLSTVLQQTGTSPQWLMVEVTEGAAMGEQAQRELDRVRALGVSISIDDFGTGFSSLSRLADLPTQQVKIDRAFVQGLGQSNETLEIVRTIVALAHALKLEILAEGVETVGQARVLMAEGVHIAQGFLFAAPMTEAECLRQWVNGVSVPKSLLP